MADTNSALAATTFIFTIVRWTYGVRVSNKEVASNHICTCKALVKLHLTHHFSKLLKCNYFVIHGGSLSLSGAVGHHGDNLVEKILSVLPLLPGHVTDVQVDMWELTHLRHPSEVQGVLAPGCLAQNQ